MTADLIRGEVADIMDSKTVVLNIGKEDRVTRGMHFVIYVEAEHLYDKKSKDLGVLEIPKAEVEVTDVQPKLSIAKSAMFMTEPYFPIYVAERKVRGPLPIDDKDIRERKIDMTVKRGDKVRQIE